MSRFVSVVVALLALGICANVGAQTIVCDGEICGGSGASNCGGTLDYIFTVTTLPASGILDALFVGTHDPDPANYTNICMPPGWAFSISSISRDDYEGRTVHGSISIGPNGTCPYTIEFTCVGCTQDPSMDFGFDHSASPNDVAWILYYSQPASTDWGAPTGVETGPVHAPSDTCWGYGDVNGDGISLAVADLSQLVQFVNFGGNTPTTMYECDFNSDGFIDQADIDMLQCYLFGGGLSCFPQYPFPTNCDPDTTRGACCGVDDCAVRAPGNCSAPDINYLGDQTPCTPDPCFADIHGTKFFDGNRNEQRDPTEGGLANWKIVLQGPVNRTTYTDQNGDYSFLDLPPSGNPALPYTLTEGAVPGWMQTYPNVMSSYLLFPDHGDNLSGYDFGNWTCDTVGQICCVKHSEGLIAWWPLDIATKNIAKDIAGLYSGLHTSGTGQPVELVPGKSGNAYKFDWTRRAFVRANDPFIAIGSGDFTIDAWIFPEQYPTWAKPSNWLLPARGILSNLLRQSHSHSSSHGGHGSFGVKLTVSDAFASTSPINFSMMTMAPTGHVAGYSSATTDPVVVVGQWQHIAVTVSRTQGTPLGVIYYNGIPVKQFTPPQGIVYCPSSESWLGGPSLLDIGHVPPFANLGYTDGNCNVRDDFFSGSIDEVEIFSRALSEEEVYRLYREDSLGKCDDYCHVPEMQAFDPSETDVPVVFTICNSSNKDVTYGWQAPPVTCILGPSGQPTTVDLPIGNLFVPAGKCRSVNLTVTVLSAFDVGDIGCYSIWVTDPTTGEGFHCDGSVVGWDEWGAWPYVSGGGAYARMAADTALAPIDMYAGDSAEVGFMVYNYTSGESYFDYQISASPSCDCDSDTIVRIGDLPLGTILEGSISIPLGDSASISTYVHLEKFAPFTFQEVALLADWDDDGSMDPIASIGIHPIIFPDCNTNGVHDSMDIAVGTSPDDNENGIPDDCEWTGEPCPYCVVGLGEAVVSYDSLSVSLTVDNIGSSGEDGVLVDLSGTNGCEVGLENLDLSTTGAGVAFEVAGVLSDGTTAAKQQPQATQVACTVGLAKAGGVIGISADYSAIGSANILAQVFLGGSQMGEWTVSGGGSVATLQDAGSGLPAISAVGLNEINPLNFVVKFDRFVAFSLTAGPTIVGDELRILSVDAIETIDYLVSMAITGELLAPFTITAIDLISGCCTNVRGNANGDQNDDINISDITYMVDYLFGIPLGPAPPCLEEGNANGDVGESINISDITYLVDYLFGVPLGTAPPACP